MSRTLSRGGLLLLAAALASACVFAAEPPSLSVHKLAGRVDRHYNQLHSLKARFTESFEGMGMHRTESGTLLMLKPGRMKWEYDHPTGKFFLVNGKFAWFYSKGDPQVQRVSSKQLNDLRSPMRYLLGHTHLEKELKHLFLTKAADGRLTLTGEPRGRPDRIRQITLTVTAEGTITGIKIEEIDGSLTRFTFTDEIPDAAIPASTFRFTPPAGVPVVDAVPPA